jgi:hypothetical protein
MSSRSLRRVLAGSLVAAFLSLSGPVSGEAADLLEVPDAPSAWLLAWQWLTDQILPAEEGEPDAAASAEVAAESGSDAGWVLDPNG